MQQTETRIEIIIIIIWPASQVAKMNQILHCDWLPERARWSYLARLDLPVASWRKNFPESHIINPLLTKLVRSRWLDIGFMLFWVFFSVSVHKHAKKEVGQYPAILSSHMVNNPYKWKTNSNSPSSILHTLT